MNLEKLIRTIPNVKIFKSIILVLPRPSLLTSVNGSERRSILAEFVISQVPPEAAHSQLTFPNSSLPSSFNFIRLAACYDTLSFPIADRLLCSAYRKSDANFVTWIQLILVALAQHAAPTQPPASSSALVAYRASIAAGLLAFLSLTMG